MLFDPDRHEAIRDWAWNASDADAAMRSIVQDIESHRMAEARWPVHPLDDGDDVPSTGFKGLYLGAAGVLWALWQLQRSDKVALSSDPVLGMLEADASYQRQPDTGSVGPSYYLGEVGILLMLWRMTGSATVADRLHAAVRSNIGNPSNEALWAAPGTMVAAWHVWIATGELRWRDLFLENVEQLWETWHFDPMVRCYLWTQDLYGTTVQYLGAGHGFAGNVLPLLKGAALIDPQRREVLYERCVETLRVMAKAEQGAFNWPPGTYTPRPGRPSVLMQWCHGAPGVVTGLADFPLAHSPEMEAMLVGAGHAIWRAGPLVKGYGLCHGTAGNGCAFLTLYRRTGDALWLQRARSFAMHAIKQRDEMRAQQGQGRYTLWTGDAGLAIYLSQCLAGTAGMPSLDFV